MGYSKPDGIAAPDFDILNTTSSIVFVHSSLKLNLNVLLVTLEDSKSKTKTNLRVVWLTRCAHRRATSRERVTVRAPTSASYLY